MSKLKKDIYNIRTKLICALWGGVIAIPIVVSVFRIGVDCDSAYYICIGERILDGYTPYIDLCVGYTPIWFYIEALFKALFKIPSALYWPYHILFYFFEVSTAYFLYKFIVLLNTKKGVAYFGAGLFLLECHWLWGNNVLLEIPFLFWGLLSCWLVIKWQNKSDYLYLVVGCLSSFAFLTKQYGAVFFLLDLYAIIFLAKKRFSTVLAYLIGYFIPILICIVLWGRSFVNLTLLNGYGTIAAADAGYDISFGNKLLAMGSAFCFAIKFLSPMILLMPVFVKECYFQGRLRNVLFAYLGIFGFLLQFYFSNSNHYFIPLAPFGTILITEFLSLYLEKKYIAIKLCVVCVCLFVSLYKTYYNRVYKLYINSNERFSQMELAKDIKNVVDADKNIFIIHSGIYYIYFLSDILPPNIKTIGYSFGPQGLNESECSQQISSADYVLRFSEDYSYESFFTDSMKTLLEKHPVVEQFQDSAVLLHKICK